MADQGRGWHGEPNRHAKAAKGEKTPGSGWHGDSEGHTKAAKGENAKPKGFIDKLKGK
jgi:hypothetical protein